MSRKIEKPGLKAKKYLQPNQIRFEDIDKLQDYYTNHAAGHQEFLRQIIARCYELCQIIRKDPKKLSLLQSHAFFEGMRRPPADDIAKWVVFFVTKAKGGAKRDRAGRYAAVIDRYLSERLRATQIEQRLKEEGGITKAYLRTSGSSALKAQNMPAMGLAKRTALSSRAAMGDASNRDENEGDGEEPVTKRPKSGSIRPKSNKDDLIVTIKKRLLIEACKQPGLLIIYAIATPNPEKGADWMDIEATRIKHRSA